MNTNQISASKIVSLEAIEDLIEGSFEHLGVLLDEAIEASASSFSSDGDEVSRIATFDNHMVVGTESGNYFNVKFENKSGEIILSAPEKLDVPVVTSSNAAKSVKEFSLRAVDALMGEDVKGAVSRLLALVELQEQSQVCQARDYPGEAQASVVSGRPWREVLEAQRVEISRQVVDRLESIRESALTAKYQPLYETDDIPEEDFENYRGIAERDLGVLSARLATLSEVVESAYSSFKDTLDSDGLDESEEDTLSHFCFFSEDLIEDLGEVRSLIADTIENEQCVMCLGQVYDTFAESLADYEIAGNFVQKMTGTFSDAA